MQKKKKIANLFLILWGKGMPIAFELQQGSPCVFPNLPNLVCNQFLVYEEQTEQFQIPQ